MSEPSRKSASKPRKRGIGGQHGLAFSVFGPHDRYPLSPARGYTPSPEATTHTYRKMAETLGIERMVILNPTPWHGPPMHNRFVEIFGGSERKG